MCQCVERAEAILRSERDAIEEMKECLEDDLSQVLMAQDEAKAHEQEAIDHYQWALKVFQI